MTRPWKSRKDSPPGMPSQWSRPGGGGCRRRSARPPRSARRPTPARRSRPASRGDRLHLERLGDVGRGLLGPHQRRHDAARRPRRPGTARRRASPGRGRGRSGRGCRRCGRRGTTRVGRVGRRGAPRRRHYWVGVTSGPDMAGIAAIGRRRRGRRRGRSTCEGRSAVRPPGSRASPLVPARPVPVAAQVGGVVGHDDHVAGARRDVWLQPGHR